MNTLGSSVSHHVETRNACVMLWLVEFRSLDEVVQKREHCPPGSEAKREPQKKGRRCCAGHCPSWARTRTLLIQSQACCQLHQGAGAIKVKPGLGGGKWETKDGRRETGGGGEG